ncbi:MAG TPA: competence protein TfoX [Rhodobacteraceae bacterium]|jgi:DNA transformation protein|nr:competence protein TfoX [Paracoccaceae bacterium]HBV56553.1 competence protein TfoX [Paracoccaceae bacterium]
MTTPVSSLRNLGPAFERDCTRAGITSAEELRAIGAHAAYARLIAAGVRPHFIGYYVLHMALQGRPWNDCRRAEKVALREAFDGLKSTAPAPSSELDRILDQIGVVPRR